MGRVCPGIARYVGYAEVDRVILLCTVVLHAVRIMDADGIAGGQIQARKQDVEPFDVDVDAALQLYIAFGLRMDIHDPSLLILHNGILRHDANGQVATQGGGVFHVQKLLDQSGQNIIRTLFTQIQAVKIQSVLNHNGGNAFFSSRLLVFVQVAQIGQRVRHGLVDGVAVVVSGVGVLDLFADLMDIGAARRNGVGLYLHLILRDIGLRLGRVTLPGSAAGYGVYPIRLSADADSRRSGCTARRSIPLARCGIPFARRGIPFARCGIPFARRGIPFARRGIPFAQRGIPFARRGVPFARRGIPFTQFGR